MSIHPDDCDKCERIEKLEKAKHETSNELHLIHLTLARIETKIEGKFVNYDTHVSDGDKFRSSIMSVLIGSIVTGLSIAGGFGIWVGTIQTRVEINSKKWDNLEQQMGVIIGHSRVGSRDSEGESSR
jgi:hypothetical protein